MIRKSKQVAAGAILAATACLPMQAIAADGIAHLGYSFGGETLATVYFTDGSSDNAKANMGLDLAGGVAFGSRHQGGFQGRVLAGYTFGGAGASNGGVEWRAPHVDLVGHYNLTDTFRVGLGGTYHLSPELKSTGDLSGFEVEYDNAFGSLVELEWDAQLIFVSMRYTAITYDVESVNGTGISGESDGDSLGLYLGVRW